MIAQCGEGMAFLYDERRRGIDVSRRLERLGKKRNRLQGYLFALRQIPLFPKTPRQRSQKHVQETDAG